MRLRFPRLHPYPKSPDEWIHSAQDFARLGQRAMAQVAAEIGDHALAEEILANADRVFPYERYKCRLNETRRGAGNRAERLAGKELRRHRT
jgi:hypothetical protein